MSTKLERLLFFDTETTGKADFRSAPEAEHQPRVVQLVALLTDAAGTEIASVSVIVKPYRFLIPDEAAAIHGITTERAIDLGVPLAHALGVFSSLGRIATHLVAHNIAFDAFLLRGECLRMVTDYPVRPEYCTMKTMTEVCRIPGPHGFKWPRLQEAYQHCFGREFAGAHNALADVRACRDIYLWQRAQEAKG
jgi:DNA polymerase III subunit epsilon